MRKYLIVAASIVLAGCVSTTDEPGDDVDPSLAATFGQVGLQAGSSIEVAIDAGGHIDMRGVGPGCSGFVYDRPDYSVTFMTGGNATLNIRVTAPVDTTLAVYTPAGTWICDNNSGGGVNPLISIAQAQAGRYAIWVGTRNVADSFPNSTLRIY